MMRAALFCLCLLAAGNAIASPVRLTASSERSDYNLSTSADGRHRVFARSDAQFANARIFESTRTASGWSTPQPIAFTDTRWRDSDPWLTPDGRTLYFISDRPTPTRGERHDLDLWRVHRTDDGWSAPEHLGDAVNSVGEELGPELHGDTLYFASSRAGGRGGLDLYAARVDADRIGAAHALPEPLNSATSESDLTFSPDGRTAAFWRVLDRRLLLHVATREGDGWSAPAPLGDAANPGPMQITPAFAADGRSLVFASNAPRAGQDAGLFDLYQVRWPLE